MTTMTTNQEVAEVLRGLVEQYFAAEGERDIDRALGAVFALMQKHARNWAPRFCDVGGDKNKQHLEDVVGVCVERMLTMLRDARNGTAHVGVVNWYSYLYGSCRYAALEYFHSSQVTPASGMTAAMRRQRQVGRMRNLLRGQLGREPEDAEIIAAVNADMSSRRADPKKQGALVDVSDLNVVLPASDIADYDAAAVADESAVITPVEGRMLVQYIVEACMEVSPEAATAARTWLGGMYAEPPYIGTVAEVAVAVDVSPQRATRIMALVRDIAKDTARSRFGISFPG